MKRPWRSSRVSSCWPRRSGPRRGRRTDGEPRPLVSQEQIGRHPGYRSAHRERGVRDGAPQSGAPARHILPDHNHLDPCGGGGARRGGRAGHPAGRERHKWRGRDRSRSVHLLPGLLRGGRGVRPRRRHRGGRGRHLQSALDGIELPSQAGEPEVRSQSASEFPILTLSLAAKNQDLVELTDYTEDEVVHSVEEVEGVASVDLIGGAEKRVEVELNPDKLKYKGLSTDAVVGAVSGAKVDVPVGSVPFDGLETPVRATSEVGGAEALEELPVGVAGGATDAPSGVTAAPSQGATAGAAPAGAAPTASPSGLTAPPAGTSAAPTGVPSGAWALRRRPARRSRCFWGTWGRCARS